MIASLSQRTSSGASATAAWEIRTAATLRARILEMGISISAATASVFGVGRPQAIGVTPTSPQTFLQEDPNEPTPLATAAVAWGTGPTVPLNFFRRLSTPATIGSGVIWTYPRGLFVAVSSSMVVWVLATSSVADMWAVEDE